MMGTKASEEVVLQTCQQQWRGVSGVESTLDDGCLLLLALEERQESIGQSKTAEIVGIEFGLNNIEVHCLGFGKVKPSLDARIKHHTVEISMRLCDAIQTRQKAGLLCDDANPLGNKVRNLV